MYIAYIIFSLTLLFVVLFVLFDMIFSILIMRVPSLSSNMAVIKKIKGDSYFKDIFIANKKLYDLGCGKGTALLALTKSFPIYSIGYEMNPIALFCAKVRRFFSSPKVRDQSRFVFGNIFKIDLSDADIIYLYLFPELVFQLEDKIVKECKGGTYIICNTFDFQTLKPVWEYKEKGSLKNIYVYKI